MKFVLFIVGMAVACALGYMTEPQMRHQLTGKIGSAPTTATPEPPKAVVIPTPPITPPAPAYDLSTLAPEQLPKTVVLKVEAEVSDASSGLKMKVQVGSRVHLVRLESETAVISPGQGNLEGFVPVSQTDIFEQLAANPPAPVVAPEPVVEPEPEPEPVVVQEEETMEDEDEEEEPAAGPVDVVATMKESVSSGQIKEFTADQVLGWKEEANEEIDGETYQTGVVAYKAETIFGEKTIQAKALIRNGKVERWIWPKSGMEIK